MVDFNVQNLAVFEIFGIEVWITQTIVNTWLIMLFLIGLAVFLRIKLRKMEEVPRGLQNVVELVIEASDGFVTSMAGEKARFVGGWFFVAFTFILVSNLSGVLGLRPPTADWATTMAMALCTFIIIQIAGMHGKGARYLLAFINPLNIIGELARPVSLSLRLFGNVLAGLIIMTLLYTLAPLPARIVLPVFLHVYFDVFMGFLQTYVFCALSEAFVSSASGEEI